MIKAITRLIHGKYAKALVRVKYKCNACGAEFNNIFYFDHRVAEGERLGIFGVRRGQSYVGENMHIDNEKWVVEAAIINDKESKVIGHKSFPHTEIHRCNKSTWGVLELQSIEDVTNIQINENI